MESRKKHNTTKRECLSAIIQNDAEQVKHLLNGQSELTRDLLLEGTLYDADDKQRTGEFRFTATSYCPEKAWMLAAIYNSRDVMKVMLEHGTDPCQKTSNGNSVLHVLVAFASTLSEEMEKKLIYTAKYIKTLVGEISFRNLLLGENDDDLRPLELAAHLGAIWFFLFIFETHEVYLMREDDYVLYKVQYFDITEYVTGPRYMQSPAYAMAHLDEDKLAFSSVKKVFLNNPMKAWFNAILYANAPYIIVWAMVRCLFIALFMSSDDSIAVSSQCSSNTTVTDMPCLLENRNSVTDNLILYLVLCGLSALMILYDIMSIIHYYLYTPKWFTHKVYGKKTLCMYQTCYRVAHFLSVLMVFVVTLSVILAYSVMSTTYFAQLVDMAVVATVCGFVWSILYFLQLPAMIGNYVIAVERMLKEFLNFTIIYAVFFLTYSFGFYKMLCTTFTPDFQSLDLAMYSTFRTMLNMVDYIGENRIGVYLVHVAYVMVVAILLLNFLIATLSSSYAYSLKHRRVLLLIQRMSIALTAERRLVKLLAPIRRRLRQKYMVYEEGRIYITREINQKGNHNYNDEDNATGFTCSTL